MLRIAAALAALTLVSTAGHASSCKGVVTIGAWNVQWLGNAASGKRPAQDPKNVASYIQASGVNLLALAEISSTKKDSTGKHRNGSLDEAFTHLNASGAQWQYEIFEKRQGARSPNDQWLGVAWNRRHVQLTGGPWKIPVSIDPVRENSIRARFPNPGSDTVIFTRWPYALKFSAGAGMSDWVIVPLHLKSNTDGPATADARAYEVELVLEGIRDLKPNLNDDDLIFLGDTNMLAADELGAKRFAQAGFNDCNERDLGTHVSFKPGERGAPFDRVFIDMKRRLTSASCSSAGVGIGPLDFKVFRPSDWKSGTNDSQFRTLLSDHLLVKAGLCIGEDDD